MATEFELPETPATPESRKERVVGLIIAAIAVALAIVTHLGNDLHQDEILAHVDASDQYAFFQAKKDRRAQLTLNRNLMELIHDRLSPAQQTLADQLKAVYTDEMNHLDEESPAIRKAGDDLLAESRALARKARVLDVGEIALQISIVLCSITILTEQGLFVRIGVVVALLGAAVAAWAMLLPH